MPRPILPPTPQSSVDLPPKLPPNLSSLELAFTLPPPALGSIASSATAPPSKSLYDVSSPPASACTPFSPTSSETPQNTPDAVTAPPQSSKKRRRASTLETLKPQPSPKVKPSGQTEAITLPPPPTRNRKIIQMKPRQPSTPSASPSTQQASAPEPKAKSKKAAAGPKSDKQAEDGKPTTAVGRKIARKTAHSLIERRRRFKMNEEFGVLKGMIPACAGVEMHKLAILQASIEYLKYLEQCVADLKASNTAATHQNKVPTLPSGGYDNDDDEDEDEDEEDEEMADPEPTPQEPTQEESLTTDSPTSDESTTKAYQIEEPILTYSTFCATAPGLVSPQLDSTQQHPQYSPTQSLYSPTQSLYSPTYIAAPPSLFTPSPNLYPQQCPPSEHGHDQVDTEATQALLLLADGSRRSSETVVPSRGRGMSVKELLSS